MASVIFGLSYEFGYKVDSSSSSDLSDVTCSGLLNSRAPSAGRSGKRSRGMSTGYVYGSGSDVESRQSGSSDNGGTVSRVQGSV